FVQECEEVQEWISEQMSAAASEEYGLDVEHVETLQQAFDNFLAQLHANEGRIEAVCESGNALLEENAPEADKVKQRVEDTRGLWEDLKELALARQEALAGARQVHEFDRSADETAAWVAEKEALLPDAGARSRTELHAQKRRLTALHADLDAIRARHAGLKEEAARLGTAFPDAKEHVTAKLEDVSEALEALAARADHAGTQVELAEQLQAYFGTYQELLAWTNEMIARVTAAELARDVAGAERLLARHKDMRAEIDAKDDDFQRHYHDGEKLIHDGHFMSAEIEERMSVLRSRRAQLEAAWERRSTVYAQHLDALLFRRDADALSGWIESRVPLVRDGKYGESVAQVEELISRHRDLEETIESQRDKFNALKRITLVEQAFAAMRDEEEAARRRSAERQEAERMQQYRRRELQRIAEERRQEATPPAQPPREVERVLGQSTETLEEASPATLERLPKHDAAVKRAESMSVVKTPKRTPSFTTRRRTQSFRRHRRPEELPPVEIEGFLERKQEAGCGGKRATVRSWRGYYSVLCGQLLCFFRDELDFASSKAAAPPVAILNATCSPAGDYTKRAHVFRLACADGAEYLFAAATRDLMRDWVAKLAFHAQLPPELQLTPYSPNTSPQDENNVELRKRLQKNAGSSSSSAASSPEPARQSRSQAEILQQHRSQQRSSATPERSERNIESTVLPSLPPRQPPQDDGADIVLRNSEQTSSWGRSRFSNGRDINAEFIKSQKEAYGGNSSTRPASVAGSGGSPALDQRPASRSSGESELSVSGVTKEKKDKKGVFGGLFSRKKRPQSHM
ncbi:spectrin alpha chain-like, partial [Ostrinia furnacalis]|uniref:spectrin alpha chain-like n=1 Tax=Ostrinia furnacalis TaxID=93504 RepID=UPI00103EC034